MAPNEFYQYFWVFFIYSFLGWSVELVFHAVSEGKFINRGFLNGPICPIYGFGVLIVALCLGPVKDNVLYLFLGSVILASVLEFITGFILEKVFNDKWWDYTNEPLNIHGYICLRSSLVWGLACVLIINVFYPLTSKFIFLIPQTFGIIILGFFLSLTIFDAIITLVETFKLKKKLVLLEKNEKGILDTSDSLRGGLSNETLGDSGSIVANKESIEQTIAIAKSGLSAVQSRILCAYPRLKRGRYKESISLLVHHSNKTNKVGQFGKLPLPFEKPQSIFEDLSITLYRNTFETVIDVLEARDKYTAGHSRRVAVLTKLFCKHLRVTPLEAELFELSASLHDLGKVGIPDATLNKCEKLNDDEWLEMRCHPDIGADIILKSSKLEHVAEIVRHHHEHWDGSGYPSGLSGHEIPKGAQIVSICDAVDSMMIKRVYRQAFSPDECKSEVVNGSGTEFNPQLVGVFLNNWDKIVSAVYSDKSKVDVSQPSPPTNNKTQ